MLGHDHALSGALAFVAVAPLLPVTGTQLAVAATLTAGAGILPDLDEPGSTIARTFGFLTGAFAWIVHQISGGHRKGTHSLLGVAIMTLAAYGAGQWQDSAHVTAGHPQLWWHLVPAGFLLALLFSAGFRGLYIGGHHADLFGCGVAALVLWQGWDLEKVTPWHVSVLAVCVCLGMLAHIAGDMLTHDGCPLLYPLSRFDFGLLPEPMRITTNKLAERWVISPLLLIALAYFLWRDAGGPVLIGTHHLAGQLSRAEVLGGGQERLRAGHRARQADPLLAGVGPVPVRAEQHRGDSRRRDEGGVGPVAGAGQRGRLARRIGGGHAGPPRRPLHDLGRQPGPLGPVRDVLGDPALPGRPRHQRRVLRVDRHE